MIEHNKQVAEELSKLLAESYTLYLKTHKYHWNVTGPMFHSLHLLFEQQYTELAEAVDTIAERIRALAGRHRAAMRSLPSCPRWKTPRVTPMRPA